MVFNDDENLLAISKKFSTTSTDSGIVEDDFEERLDEQAEHGHPPSISKTAKRIALIGGGPAAVSFCLQFFEKHIASGGNNGRAEETAPVEVYIFERGDRIGPGMAYVQQQSDASNSAHRLNVPKGWISPVSGGAGGHGDFATWLSANNYAANTDFPPRMYFGQYLESLWADLLAKSSATSSSASHIHFCPMLRSNVDEILLIDETANSDANCYQIFYTDEHGMQNSIYADHVVLCIGHLPSDAFGHLCDSSSGKRYAHTAEEIEECLNSLNGTESIGILGTKLSAIDVALELDARAHAGPIWMGSRTGLLPAVNTTAWSVPKTMKATTTTLLIAEGETTALDYGNDDDGVDLGENDEEEDEDGGDNAGTRSMRNEEDKSKNQKQQQQIVGTLLGSIEAKFRKLLDDVNQKFGTAKNGGEKKAGEENDDEGTNGMLDQLLAHLFNQYKELLATLGGVDATDTVMMNPSMATGRFQSIADYCEWIKSLRPQDWLAHQIGECELGEVRAWQLLMWGLWPCVTDVWRALSPRDQAEFKRKWHSVFATFFAPFPLENARKLYKMLQSGRLRILRQLDRVGPTDVVDDDDTNRRLDGGFVMAGRNDEEVKVHVDVLINATGPGSRAISVPLIERLVKRRMATLHAIAGIEVDPETLLVVPPTTNEKHHENHRSSPAALNGGELYAIGELTKGDFLATACMTKVAAQADRVAQRIHGKLRDATRLAKRKQNNFPLQQFSLLELAAV